MGNSLFLFGLVLILLNTISKPFTTSLNLNSTTDRNALLEFKNNIISDPNGILSESWSSSNTCVWIGVSCGNKHQRVTSLNVSGFGLTGTVPPHLGNLTFLRYLDISFNDFTGAIPPELSRLHRLRVLDVGVNSFTAEIPSWAGALPQLEQLILRNNTFSGVVPPSLFNNNSQLQKIDMSYNSLSGSIPEEVGNCSSLQILNLNVNHLMDFIPSDMFNNLPNLKKIGLSSNQIEGRIPPNIWKCKNLEIVSLSFNRFNGNIPSEIASLSMLRYLYLGYNDFKGGIPEELGNLSRLEILSIPAASLTGLIPKQIANCTSLNQINLGDNYYLTGELPQELANLQFLEVLSMFNNSMYGSIPSSIFNISSLRIVELSANQFSGNLILPWKFPGISNLEELYLIQNALTGLIPSSITNASMLTNLELAMNSFTGPIPNFGNLRRLQILMLWNNNLTGAESPGQELGFLSSLTNCPLLEELIISGNPMNGVLPTSIGNLSTSLYDFGAEYINLMGVIPYAIANLSSLRVVALSGNQLTGPIPPTIQKLNQLQRLYLNMNQLQGYIPPDLCLASSLGELNLSDNDFKGPIPKCLGSVKSLRSIDLGSNKLSSNIPSNFWNLKDLLVLNLSSNYMSGQLSDHMASLKEINTLDLSYNKFSGIIPRSIEGCQSLEFLSLSNNKLEGFIPASLGDIRGLGTLDLSNNNLSGSIPKSLESLIFLRSFNVSYNKLEGEIPTGGRFINFTAQSFLNNSALCGATTHQVPRCMFKKNIRTTKVKKSDRWIKYILPPISVIILATIIVLVVLMRRRKLKRVPTPTDISVGANWRRVSYLELVRGTRDFSETNLLGRGSFGSVFKATLSDGFNVAVKVFNLQSERVARSFVTECEILSNIRHRNLVRIIGCCSNTDFKALIFGYMTNGSLDKWLHSDNYCLDLIQRLHIAIDVALALEYLHHGHTFPIVHCDIKPSNVLLNEELVAHLADFGISKLLEGGETMVLTKTLATIGYAAPEYGSEGKVSTNGDVYSYGILLLEIFTRKKPTDEVFNEEMSLKEWTLRAIQENAVIEVVAPGLLSREDPHLYAKEEECVSSIFSLAMKCLAISPEQRINMIETVSTLHKIKARTVGGTKRRQQHALSS